MKKYQGINGLKRTRTKDGRTYYYLDGKRVSSKVASEFQRKDSARRSKIAKESAKNLLYYKGKALKKDESFIIRQTNPKLKTNKLDDVFKSRAEIKRVIKKQTQRRLDFFDNETSYGKFRDGFDGEIKKKGVKDIAFWLKESAFNNYKVKLTTDYKGDMRTIRGAVSVLKFLAIFEIEVMDEIKAYDPMMVIKTEFEYIFEVGYNVNTIFLTLIDNNPDMTITDYIKDGQDIIDKYVGSGISDEALKNKSKNKLGCKISVSWSP